MTVNYHAIIRESHPLRFYRLLLFSWKASLWKAVLPQLIVWLLIYHVISFIYRFGLNENGQRNFEYVVYFFRERMSRIPLEFLLGFFVTIVFNRWTNLYQNIGFIDNVGLMTAEYVRGHNEMGRRIRRNILRYSEVGQILLFRDISMRVRKRFPTLDSIVAAGFLLAEEKEQLEEYAKKDENDLQWVPFRWAYEMCNEARRLGLIENDYYQQVVLSVCPIFYKEIKTFRTNLEWLRNYDWTPFPLLYPTVASLMVHIHFTVALLARQLTYRDGEGKELIDVYFPYMETLEFIFYMGWLKVAETMFNPFGEDDDDFEGNALIDRNITMGLMIVDQGFDNPPELRKDQFWNDTDPRLLYAEESARFPQNRYEGSVSHINLVHFGSQVHMIPRTLSFDQLGRHHFHSHHKNHEDKIGNGLDPRASTRTEKSDHGHFDHHGHHLRRNPKWRHRLSLRNPIKRPTFDLGAAVFDYPPKSPITFVEDLHENGKKHPERPF